MLTLERERRETTLKTRDFTNGSGWEDDTLLPGDAVVVDRTTGEPVIVQVAVSDKETVPVRRAIREAVAARSLWDNVGERMSGITYRFSTFGYKTRAPLRKRDLCSACKVNRDVPAVYRALEAFTTDVLIGTFAEWLPGQHARQMEACAPILPEWRIGGTAPWTSGIINDTAQLQYHRDGNNIPGSMSAMLTLRSFVRGGMLHVPEYGVVAACPDSHLLFFCGSDLIHGVTPFSIRQTDKRQAYRYTTVWYAGSGMAKCLPWEQELAWGKASRTAREDRAGAGR